MKAGCELDALVAEKVLGSFTKKYCETCRRLRSSDLCDHLGGVAYAPYSTDIAAAWEVVEKLVRFQLTAIADEPNRRWACRSAFNDSVEADTAPHAICLAALKAVGEEI